MNLKMIHIAMNTVVALAVTVVSMAIISLI